MSHSDPSPHPPPIQSTLPHPPPLNPPHHLEDRIKNVMLIVHSKVLFVQEIYVQVVTGYVPPSTCCSASAVDS